MTKATIHIKGQVAELMENKGKLHAKIICDTDNLLVSLEDIDQVELGRDVSIDGEIRIKSINIDGLEVYNKESQ